MYCYYMTERPAGPGAQPKEGLVNIIDCDPTIVNTVIKRRAYALLEYNRPLTHDELLCYSILPAISPDAVQYRGFVFEWDEWQALWRVYFEGRPQDTVAYEDSIEKAKSEIDEYLGTTEKEG